MLQAARLNRVLDESMEFSFVKSLKKAISESAFMCANSSERVLHLALVFTL
jgi:hypothetical protein